MGRRSRPVWTGDQPIEPSLPEIDQQRRQLYQELAATDDFRRCGKSNCACADPAHPGHGSRYLLTMSQAGNTKAQQVAEGPELEKTRREVANYERFRGLVDGIGKVLERICEANPIAPLAPD